MILELEPDANASRPTCQQRIESALFAIYSGLKLTDKPGQDYGSKNKQILYRQYYNGKTES